MVPYGAPGTQGPHPPAHAFRRAAEGAGAAPPPPSAVDAASAAVSNAMVSLQTVVAKLSKDGAPVSIQDVQPIATALVAAAKELAAAKSDESAMARALSACQAHLEAAVSQATRAAQGTPTQRGQRPGVWISGSGTAAIAATSSLLGGLGGWFLRGSRTRRTAERT
jgi:hypothetical protein